MLHLHGGFLRQSKTGRKFMDFCAEAPILFSVPLICLTLMTCAPKLIKMFSKVLCNPCCNAFFLVNLQGSNTNAVTKLWPAGPHNQILLSLKECSTNCVLCVFKLLSKPLKLLLSQLCKFFQNYRPTIRH